MAPKAFQKKILITGATGFIGANLTHYLVRHGIRPQIIIRKESNPWRIRGLRDKVNCDCLDLSERGKTKRLIGKIKPKIIYHCAAYGGYPFQKDLDKIINTNIIGTKNLLEACSRFNFDCFVNTGSSSEYGTKNHPMKEEDYLEPISEYGVAKASSTLFCQAMAKRESLPIVTLRLFSPYGYYEEKTRLITSVIISCLKKKSPIVSSPNPVRDFIFIDDVVDAYIKVVESKKRLCGQVLNVGSGIQFSVGEVVNKIIDLVSEDVRPKWGEMSNPRREPTMWLADISKIKKILNWQPRYDLTEGLRSAVNWFRKNISLYHG